MTAPSSRVSSFRAIFSRCFIPNVGLCGPSTRTSFCEGFHPFAGKLDYIFVSKCLDTLSVVVDLALKIHAFC